MAVGEPGAAEVPVVVPIGAGLAGASRQAQSHAIRQGAFARSGVVGDRLARVPYPAGGADGAEALARGLALPREICHDILRLAKPKVLATVAASLGPGLGEVSLELLSADGEEEEWLHKDARKSLPVSLCLAVDGEGTFVIAVKHLDRGLRMVETCLCTCSSRRFLLAASADGWADLINEVCVHFEIQTLAGVRCTADFLEAARGREGRGGATAESIAAALSQRRSERVAAISWRRSDLAPEERWRDAPMLDVLLA